MESLTIPYGLGLARQQDGFGFSFAFIFVSVLVLLILGFICICHLLSFVFIKGQIVWILICLSVPAVTIFYGVAQLK